MSDPISRLGAWLERPVYGTGVLLYEQLILAGPSGSAFILTMLKTGEDNYNRDTLTTALRQHHTALTETQQKRAASYPPELNDSLTTAKGLMDERTVLKERMRMQYNGGICEGEQLKGWAYRVLAIRDELKGTYDRKAFFDRHGYMPDSRTTEGTDSAGAAPERTAGDLFRRKHTLRTYVTRTTKELVTHELDTDRYKHLSNKLKTYTIELNRVEEELTELLQTNGPIHD